jgi:hypothetical protein
LGDIFQKKMRPTPKNIAQMAKFRPIWSHWLGTAGSVQKSWSFKLFSTTKEFKYAQPSLINETGLPPYPWMKCFRGNELVRFQKWKSCFYKWPASAFSASSELLLPRGREHRSLRLFHWRQFKKFIVCRYVIATWINMSPNLCFFIWKVWLTPSWNKYRRNWLLRPSSSRCLWSGLIGRVTFTKNK